jgi:hypothetical protein
MTDDLIARLRCYPANRLCRQVADALEEKDARIAELEAALKPFSDMANYLDEPDDGETCGYAINCGDLRAARAALEKK